MERDGAGCPRRVFVSHCLRQARCPQGNSNSRLVLWSSRWRAERAGKSELEFKAPRIPGPPQLDVGRRSVLS